MHPSAVPLWRSLLVSFLNNVPPSMFAKLVRVHSTCIILTQHIEHPHTCITNVLIP